MKPIVSRELGEVSAAQIRDGRINGVTAAVAAARPMTQNGYKVQVARTAVKRAILEAGGMLNV